MPNPELLGTAKRPSTYLGVYHQQSYSYIAKRSAEFVQEHEQTMAVDGTNIGAVAVHDAIRAAQREGEFEKLARQKAESDLNVTSEALSDANKKVRQLQTQLQEAQKSVTRVSALEVQLKAVQEDLDKKAEDLAGVQKKLKDCKQDVVCKAERLKAAKVCAITSK